MTVKEKLDAYRRKKKQQKMTESIKNAFGNVFSLNHNNGIEKLAEESAKEQEVKLCKEPQDIENTDDDSWEDIQEHESTVMTKVTYLLCFLLWITLYMIALECEFGAVYFILSALIFIWCNTRSRPKQRGEPSAYSVFNPNCEAIQGTLDASQFEREIGYSVISAR